MAFVTRRTFFQGAAYAAAATRVMGANDRVRVGIIGLGGRGQNHLSEFLRFPDSQVAALCDVNQPARERSQAVVQRAGSPKAKEFVDMRKLFDDKEIDAVTMATPNHWHALGTIWACQAGKDVYVEKPASHNIFEGNKMIEAARKNKRIVMVGMQSRSNALKQQAMKLLHDGFIGKLYLAKGVCFKRRNTIGRTPQEPVPAGLDWDIFLGPAPMRPYTKNRFAYNWHWFWDTGNGDIGNQGVHEMDICRWGFKNCGFPKTIYSTGGKYIYDDDQETPNTQYSTFDYGDFQIHFEVRGILTGPEGGLPVKAGNTVGNLFYGSDGWMWIGDGGLHVYKGEKNERVSLPPLPAEPKGAGEPHMQNFLAAVRTRDAKLLTADVETGAISAALCHLANISYRVGRKLTWDSKAGQFVNDAEADKLLTRDYRKPYVVA